MPETTINKDDCVELWKDDVWLSRQILSMQSVSVSERVEVGSNPHLRLCILSSNSRHIATALLSCMNIRHGSLSVFPLN
jgi:hypothetical protein